MSLLRRRAEPAAALRATVGSLTLPNAVMGASGTAGYGAELARYLDLADVGAIVTKSLAPFAWQGNPAPRVHETSSGMINAVGLQGPGVERWLTEELPELAATGTRVIASIWGRTVDDYRRAAEMLADAPSSVVAVEVNISCPNTEDRGNMFAHSVAASAEVIAATEACRRPRWAKLSPNTPDLVAVAGAAHEAGAEAVTLTNTLIGMVIDTDARRPLLGNGSGGLSGPAIRPVAVRAVFETHAAHPYLPIVGVGGVASAADAVEFLLAGARAVQVGTATFADPRSIGRVRDELSEWCHAQGLDSLDQIIGAAHR